jgi:hypothetical protein
MMLTMPHDAGYAGPTIAINSQRLGEVAEESTAHFCKKYVATRYHKIPDANRFSNGGSIRRSPFRRCRPQSRAYRFKNSAD